MNKIVLLVLLVWVNAGLLRPAVAAEAAPLDSLKQALRAELRAERTDTGKVRILCNLAYETSASNMAESQRYAEQALRLARQIRYDKGIAMALVRLGRIQKQRGRYTEALQGLEEALRLAQRVGAEKLVSVIRYTMATAYSEQGNDPKALENYLRALKYYETHPDRQNCAAILQAIAYVYNNQNDYEQAKKYHMMALDSITSDAKRLPSYFGLGSINYNQKQYKAALQWYERALELGQRRQDTTSMSTVLCEIGSVYMDLRDYSKARQYAEKALVLAQAISDESNTASAEQFLARLHYRLGQYPTALRYGQSALRYAQSAQVRSMQQELYLLLSDIYRKQGRFEEALSCYHQGKTLQDSIYSRTNSLTLTRLQNQYDQSKQEAKLLQQRLTIQRLQQQRKIGWLWAGLAAALALGGSGAGVLWARQQRLARQRDQAQAAARAAALEAEQLAAQARLQQVQHELDLKNQELASMALNITHKGELLSSVKEELDTIARAADQEARHKLNRVRHSIDLNASNDKDWEQFSAAFEQVHHGFFEALRQRYPDITPYECKLAALLRLNLASKDIASILGISEDSVKKARYRLRRKLQLDTATNLADFIGRLEYARTAGAAEVLGGAAGA